MSEKKRKETKPKVGRPAGSGTFASDESPVQARLVSEMRQALKELAAKNGTKESEEVRAAIRERLIKFGMWPPSETKE